MSLKSDKKSQKINVFTQQKPKCEAITSWFCNFCISGLALKKSSFNAVCKIIVVKWVRPLKRTWDSHKLAILIFMDLGCVSHNPSHFYNGCFFCKLPYFCDKMPNYSICNNFGQWLRTTVTKTDVTRWQILLPQCTKFDLGWGCAPDPAGAAYSTPQILKLEFWGKTIWMNGNRWARKGERTKRWGKGGEEGGMRDGRGGSTPPKTTCYFAHWFEVCYFHKQGIHTHQTSPQYHNAASASRLKVPSSMHRHTAHYGQTWCHP